MNEIKLVANEPQTLAHGDFITFGTSTRRYIVSLEVIQHHHQQQQPHHHHQPSVYLSLYENILFELDSGHESESCLWMVTLFVPVIFW